MPIPLLFVPSSLHSPPLTLLILILELPALELGLLLLRDCVLCIPLEAQFERLQLTLLGRQLALLLEVLRRVTERVLEDLLLHLDELILESGGVAVLQ